VQNGIVVDDCARTSDPDIVAAGDCTNYPSKWSGARVRLESVQNAIEQARTAASTLCGLQRSHQALPWFWSDQYDTRLQTAGLLSGHDAYVVRGDTAAGSFSVFYFRSNTLVACDSVNRPLDHVIARRLIESGLAIEPILLADEGHSLKQFITPPVIRSSTSPSIASAGETI
jgi:3-phenylpropionate/trans-cinnamate dioxygenase ferredoxin reductase subunit